MRALLLVIAISVGGCSKSDPARVQEPAPAQPRDEAATWQQCATALRATGETGPATQIEQYVNALTMRPFQGGPANEGQAATNFVKNSAHQVASSALSAVAQRPRECLGLQ